MRSSSSRKSPTMRPRIWVCSAVASWSAGMPSAPERSRSDLGASGLDGARHVPHALDAAHAPEELARGGLESLQVLGEDLDLHRRPHRHDRGVDELGLHAGEGAQDLAYARDGCGLALGRRAVGKDEVDLGQVLAEGSSPRGGGGKAADDREDALEALVTDELPLDPLGDVGGGGESGFLGKAQLEGELALREVGDEVRTERRPQVERGGEDTEGQGQYDPAPAERRMQGGRVHRSDPIEQLGGGEGENVEGPRDQPPCEEHQGECEGEGEAHRREEHGQDLAEPVLAVADGGECQPWDP